MPLHPVRSDVQFHGLGIRLNLGGLLRLMHSESIEHRQENDCRDETWAIAMLGVVLLLLLLVD